MGLKIRLINGYSKPPARFVIVNFDHNVIITGMEMNRHHVLIR